MIAITNVVVFVVVLGRSCRLWQCTITNVVHFLGNFTRRLQGTIASFNPITDVVVVARTVPVIAIVPITVIVSIFTVASVSVVITVVIVTATTLSTLSTVGILTVSSSLIPSLWAFSGR